MHAIAETPLEAIGIEQALEELKILFFAIARRCGESSSR